MKYVYNPITPEDAKVYPYKYNLIILLMLTLSFLILYFCFFNCHHVINILPCIRKGVVVVIINE